MQVTLPATFFGQGTQRVKESVIYPILAMRGMALVQVRLTLMIISHRGYPSGEPEGSYRLYRYNWHSKDEYEMESVQYSETGEPA